MRNTKIFLTLHYITFFNLTGLESSSSDEGNQVRRRNISLTLSKQCEVSINLQKKALKEQKKQTELLKKNLELQTAANQRNRQIIRRQNIAINWQTRISAMLYNALNRRNRRN